jgi:cyclopropane fatty-acyl-phospholipid synthase-like methyltransferase
VEVPIVWEFLRNSQGKILEVGNVLSHYYHVTHDVLDKYEKGDGVINQDIVDFHPMTRYDIIVSISTLEHVGWDENPKDPKKVLRAIENLTKNCLTQGGIMITTVPLGHNPELDNKIKQGCTGLGNQYFLKRLSKKNVWKQTDLEECKEVKYDFPFQRGNAIVVSIKK